MTAHHLVSINVADFPKECQPHRDVLRGDNITFVHEAKQRYGASVVPVSKRKLNKHELGKILKRLKRDKQYPYPSLVG